MIYPTSNSRESFFRQAPEKTFTPIEKKLSPLLLFKEDRFVEKFNLNTTQDGDPALIYVNGDYEVPYGTTLTPTNRCKGLYLIINGTLTINGTISMTARGANAEGRWLVIDHNNISWYTSNPIEKPKNSLYVKNTTGLPGRTGSSANQLNGSEGCCGAGGGGNGYNVGGVGTSNSGYGGNGTSFSGGAGGTEETALGNYATPGTGANGRFDGGPGAPPGTWYRTNGGGAGNPALGSGAKGSDGTGGSIIIFCKNIIIRNVGRIVANGSNGALTANYNIQNSGGGSGGGSINIIYKNSYVNDGLISVTGGQQKGGNGCVQIKQNKDLNFNFWNQFF